MTSCEVTSTKGERLFSCVQVKISGIMFETSIMQDDEKRSQASGAFTSFVDTLLACAPGLKTLTLEHTRRWGDGEKANPTVSTTKSEGPARPGLRLTLCCVCLQVACSVPALPSWRL